MRMFTITSTCAADLTDDELVDVAVALDTNADLAGAGIGYDRVARRLTTTISAPAASGDAAVAVVRRGVEDAVAAITGGEIGVLAVEAVEVE